MILMFGLMQASKKIPFEDPQVVQYARLAYVLSNVILFGIYFIVRLKINSKNDLTTLKFVEPPSQFGGSSERKLTTTTVKDYDLQQVSSAVRSSFTGIAILLFMHFKLGYTNPLVMQSILPIKSLFEQKVVQIHLFGKPATGDLKRPFQAPSLFGPGAFETDKNAINAAEKSGSGGVKNE
ncbi:inorganic phosphate transporter Pho88 [Lipomyces japonicus]|uniref:inorganic phosphate transporter Pho88 n=1 Tax=Lipomyces japonicus TaxID=56871 RepID=UPI0034CD24D1